MFVKSLKDFFKNPIITIPNIIFLITYKFFLDWYLSVSGLNSPDLAADITNTVALQKSATLIAVFLLVMLAAVFITAFITSWTNTMCKYAVEGQQVRIFEAFKEALKYYWRILGVVVLIGAIFIGISIVIVLSCIPLALSIQNTISAKAVIMLIVVLLLFFLGIIFLSICFSPIQAVLVYDNLGIGESISKGFKLGLKKFFPILGVVLLLALVGIIINLPLQLWLNLSDNTILSYVSSIISTYLGIFTIVYIMNLYKNSKSGEPSPIIEEDYMNSADSSYEHKEVYKNYGSEVFEKDNSDDQGIENKEVTQEDKNSFRL